ncbi:hypothetical protein OESDEN_24480, partial [Oesophagostomum dentatum]
KHELEDEESKALSGVEFDPNQDSIAYIGTHVEKIEGTSMISTAQQTSVKSSKTSLQTLKKSIRSYQKSKRK